MLNNSNILQNCQLQVAIYVIVLYYLFKEIFMAKHEAPLQVRADDDLKERIKKGMKKKGFRSMSDYVRNAVLAELIRDGVE